MLQLAQRVGRAKPSTIMVIAQKARQLKAAGRDIISFSVGVPNFLPGDHVYAAAREALAHDSGQYGSNRGSEVLQDAFLKHIEALGFAGYGRDHLRCTVLDDVSRYLGHRWGEDQRLAMRSAAKLQARARTAGRGTGAQAESILVQQPIQPDWHGLHA